MNSWPSVVPKGSIAQSKKIYLHNCTNYMISVLKHYPSMPFCCLILKISAVEISAFSPDETSFVEVKETKKAS